MLCAFLKDRPPTTLSVRVVKPNPWLGEIIVSARAGSKSIVGPKTGNLIYESARSDLLLASIFLLLLDLSFIIVNGRYERDGKAKLRAQ
jgi:hypothetical protein